MEKITKNTQWWLPLTSIDEKFQSPNLKNKGKNTKNPNPYDIQWSMSQQKTKKKFLNDLKYLQFTIEVYGKNWYIAMYHAQSDLV